MSVERYMYPSSVWFFLYVAVMIVIIRSKLDFITRYVETTLGKQKYLCGGCSEGVKSLLKGYGSD